MSVSAKQEASTRPRPIAHCRDESSEERVQSESARPPSESRLQSAVAWRGDRADSDPDADIPCTD